MATAEARSEGPDLSKRAHELATETRAVVSTLETTIRELEKYLTAQMKEHPYATLIAATGVGYVLGGGLPSRLTGLLLGVSSRVAIEFATRQIGTRLAANGQR